MKTFDKWLEWKAQQMGPAIQPNLPDNGNFSFQQLDAEIRRCVQESLAYLQAHPDEEDRIEFEACGMQIQVWATKINTHLKYHLGYKSSWENNYHETSVDNLIEYLYKIKGSHKSY